MDLKIVRELIALMEQHDLSEVEVEEEGHRVRLRKHVADARAPVGNPAAPAPAAGRVPAAPVAAESPAGAAPAKEAPGTAQVKSPMVGTFYRAPNPEAAPFVDVGDKLTPESVVCIVEAMKVMNEIKAEVAGVVEAVLVENGEAVEFGQALFRVRTA
ncbi:MAG: acetyl-CoA carboxylase biotin carboxyl carrier protein [Planctomycetales bacterium]|nr:acetyl-CoA carboxylase biotin carboxyl carrier protein [Planctomycetales bacterium]